MEIQSSFSNSSSLLEQTAFEGKLDVSNASKLKIKTAEGDLVTLSSRSKNALEESAKSSLKSDGTLTQEFSSASLAASNYSILVQGDLNEEELAAIQELTARVSPIAEKFFNNEEFSLEETGNALAQSLGVLQEIELEFQQTITASYSEAQFSRQPVEGTPQGQPLPPSAGLRDIAGLFFSVVDAEFSKQASALTGSAGTLKSLEELAFMLKEKLKELLEENETPPIVPDSDTPPTPAENATLI